MTEKIQPSLRWGVIGTGWIATEFTRDLLLDRPDARASHSFVAIGSSSTQKGNTFVSTIWASASSSAPRPTVYDDYHSVYNDPNVDIVYIGTPHALHAQSCLDAIAAGKHVLCEKPLTINEKEAQTVIAAAKEKGVFLMEAVWTRFFPLVSSLHSILHVEKRVGGLHRLFCDFGLDMQMSTLSPTSRVKDPALGAGALLDIGIYCLTLARVILDGKAGVEASEPEVMSTMTIVDGIDYSDVVILSYPPSETQPQRTAICTATVLHKSPEDFCRVEGDLGSVTVFGRTAAAPFGFRIKLNESVEEEVLEFERPGMGFHYEADAVALDIAEGRRENAIMPLEETARMMRLMDRVRKANGVKYPQDD
ncbi:hypothetical protein W97_04141 [Coniosporium apollinis CBS 100218]|uniref:D-xylose 1-dehydrogenase (NADP(+), D-xylono-1,5-lactone-forming) n=1 Tax=Coniosporium apollinis (strain CBS 100218) TaxID=1168221 RepID=R7YSJ8_CONA1|nr:uncharacterized protein W97_04141 [Coniosporium apollinis CBS 100218]EON64907.1 hypothetical protein W97_04141 [Coniosporium apollinis CBS 100218]